MATKMTQRERMLAVYRGEPVDHPAIAIKEGNLPTGSEELMVRTQGVGLIYSLPVTTSPVPASWSHEVTLSEVKQVEQRVEYRWEGNVRKERQCFSTPVGELFQEPSTDFGNGLAWRLHKRYITCPEDYKILEYITEHTVFTLNKDMDWYTTPRDLDQAGVWMGELDTSPYWKLAFRLAGMDRLREDIQTHKEVVESVLEAMTRKQEEQIEYAPEYPADIYFQQEDAGGDWISPENFERYCLPIYQKISRAADQAGKPYVIRLGRGFEQLAGQLVRTGISGIEFPMNAEQGLAQVRQMFPGMALSPMIPGIQYTAEEAACFARQLRQSGVEGSFLLRADWLPEDCRTAVLSALCQEFY